MDHTTTLAVSYHQGAIRESKQTYHHLTYEEIITDYLNDLDCSDTTKQIYRRSLKTFKYYLDKKGLNLLQVDREVVLNYKSYLLKEHVKNEEKVHAGNSNVVPTKRGLSARTAGLYIRSGKSLYRFLKGKGLFIVNPFDDVKAPKVKRQFSKRPLTLKQSKEFLALEDNLRDKAIRHLILQTGLRTIEVSNADIGDLTFIGDTRVLKVKGKGRDEKDTFVEIRPHVNEALTNYIKSRKGVEDTDPLFVSVTTNPNKQGRLTTRSISRVMKANLETIGLIDKCFTAHSLRHSTACNILRLGGTTEQAQQVLRHSDISTTQIYTATLNEERRLANSGEALLDSLFTS